ncbi:uncharacterized protein LOC113999634 isoform X2 [Pipra filicauda]|uniref:Uncharacterized protein LOC113999634 isoform X2 n=1 Tax=Pipra filicauda TaxID=649802 RepID=A0A6J2IH53_9PASS|nr:uncharacterized protein LOC113999634 isoform X2 [Pipra filicauda]
MHLCFSWRSLADLSPVHSSLEGKSQLCFLWSRQGRINQEEQGTLTGAAVSPDRRAEPQRRKQHQHSPQSRENRCSWKLFWKMGKLESLEELPTCICLSSFSSGEERENSRHVIPISQACRDLQSGLIHLWEEQSRGITGDVGAQCSVVQRASGMVGIIREEIEENPKRLLDTTLNPSHICASEMKLWDCDRSPWTGSEKPGKGFSFPLNGMCPIPFLLSWLLPRVPWLFWHIQDSPGFVQQCHSSITPSVSV